MSYQHGLQLTAEQDLVYSAFAQFKDNDEGVEISAIMHQLPQLPAARVQAAVEYLIAEGHLFSTIDERHFSLCM